MNDFFPRMTMKPNVDCDEFHCREKQKAFAKSEVERIKKEALTKGAVTEETVAEVLHEENDWGISLVEDTSCDSAPLQISSQSKLAEGLQHAYDPRPKDINSKEAEKEEENSQSLDELMAQMKNL